MEQQKEKSLSGPQRQKVTLRKLVFLIAGLLVLLAVLITSSNISFRVATLRSSYFDLKIINSFKMPDHQGWAGRSADYHRFLVSYKLSIIQREKATLIGPLLCKYIELDDDLYQVYKLSENLKDGWNVRQLSEVLADGLSEEVKIDIK